MNYTKYILLLVFSFIFLNNSNAQKQKTEPINTGFVFIDGKYIAPPYLVEINKTNIFINNILVDTTTIHKYKNPPKRKNLKKLPILPPDTLTVREAMNYKNPETNKIIYSDVFYFYYNKYGFDKANELLYKYYLEVPTIKKYCIQKRPFIIIVTENGDTLNINGTFLRWEIQKPLSNGKIKKQLKGRQKRVLKKIQERLTKGGCLFSHNKVFIYSTILNQNKSEYFFNKGLPIINDKSLTTEQKICKLKNSFGFSSYSNILEKFMQKGIQTNILNKRIEKIKTSYNEKTLKSYSPNEKDIVYLCPYTYDDAFNGDFYHDYQDEYELLDDKLGGYGYNSVTTHLDETNDQNADISIYTWRNINASVVFISAHGSYSFTYNGNLYNHPNGIVLAVFSDEMAATTYIDNADYVVKRQNPSGNWLVIATEDFFDTNIKNNLNTKQSIVFLSVCKGANLQDNIGGGAVLSYNQEINANNSYTDFQKILKNMNGELNSGDERKVNEAYIEANSSNGLQLYPTNSDLTLCPAPLKDSENPFSPANDEHVSTAVNGGYIKFDTWCDANKNALSAITLSGNISGVNAEWDNPQGGKSKQLNFSWTSGSGEIAVTLDPNYIVSYGGGEHKLDFDRQTPNGEIGTYTFTIDETIPTGVPVADFNTYINGNQVTFEDLSTQSPTHWSWDFGDGTSSNDENTSHTYQGNGSYTVSLTVSNDDFIGSDTKTKTIVIDGTPFSFIVSGYVYDFDNINTGINGATVEFSGLGSTTTSSNGYYQKAVNTGWTGTITASKSGYSSSSISISNPVYSDISGQVLYIDELNGMYIEADINPATPGQTIEFTVIGQPSNIWEYNWNFGDGQTSYMQSPLCAYNSYGNYNVTLNMVDNSGFELEPINYAMVVSEDQYTGPIYEPSFNSNCSVADVGQSVTFYDESVFPTQLRIYWQWYFDSDNNNDYDGNEVSPIYFKLSGVDIDENQRIINHTYYSVGHKTIKLQSYTTYHDLFQSFDAKYDKIKLYNEKDSWGGINVVDCDYTSTPMFYPLGMFYYGFNNSSYDSYANDNWNGPINIYGGSFEFNGVVNDFLNNNKYEISACNEIIINGDVEFIADGSNELILTSGEIPNCQETYLSNYNQPENNDIQLDIDNTLKANVYPNPFTKNFNIEIEVESNQNINIEISNIDGKIINTYNKNIISGINTLLINANNLDKSIYFVKIITHDKSKVYKIIKTID